jgi:hypothetical protein
MLKQTPLSAELQSSNRHVNDSLSHGLRTARSFPIAAGVADVLLVATTGRADWFLQPQHAAAAVGI